MQPLFDPKLRAIRRDRAARSGTALFLFERAFDDILERIGMVNRRFGSALILGCPDPQWPRRLSAHAEKVAVIDPGPLFARAAGGLCVREEELDVEPGSFDLCVAIGTLDSVNDLGLALKKLSAAMRPDGLLIGAIAGGHGLPRLRSAMLAADRLRGAASPRVHPRIEAAALAAALSACGWQMPVIDVDRVKVSYRSLEGLVADLRAMAATNVLIERSRTALARDSLQAARNAFREAGEHGRTEEIFELLHFAAWTAAGSPGGT